jgi:hypothetical protein
MGELAIQRPWRISLPEPSALAIRLGGAGEPLELLAVGDKLYRISAGEAEPPGDANVSGDLSETVNRWTLESGADSQWEGLAVDGILDVPADDLER